MKVINFLFKFIIAVLAICGACYLFVDIVDRLNSADDDADFEDEECTCCSFLDRVKKAADKQVERIR